MIPKPWDKILSSDITALIEEGIPENATLDYKQSLPDHSYSAQWDFLADVAAMANAAGGDLIFGLREKRVEGKPTATPEGFEALKFTTRDEVIRRLESLIRSGIEPNVGVKIRFIDGLPAGPILIVRVPASVGAPHMVTCYTKDKLKPQFYRRHNGGNHPMDIGEIRSAFALSETRYEQFKTFRTERLTHLRSSHGDDDDVLCLHGRGARIVLHIIPFNAFDLGANVDIRHLGDRNWEKLPGIIEYERRRPFFNYEGFLIEDLYGPLGGPRNKTRAYVQFFRNGSTESAFVPREEKYIDNDFEPMVIRRARAYLEILQELGVNPPVILALSLFGVKGFSLVSLPNGPTSQYHLTRDAIDLAPVMLNDWSEPIEQVMRSIFDAIWQCVGLPRSYNYDDEGNWIGRD